MFSRIQLIFKESFVSMRRHIGLGFATIFCIACVLIFAGILGIIYLNATHTINSVISDVRFDVVFKMPVEENRETALATFEEIKSYPEVSSAIFVTNEEAFQNVTKDDPELVELLDGQNPLPDKASIKPANIDYIETLKEQIQSLPGVENVVVADQTILVLENMRNIAYKVGLVIIIIVLIVSLVLIHHTIQLAIFSRRKEINIMSLVGAAPATIISSFVIEGIFYGIFGSIFAFILLYIGYYFATIKLKVMFKATLMPFTAVELIYGFLTLFLVAVALGFIGSFMSANKYIRSPKSRITNA